MAERVPPPQNLEAEEMLLASMMARPDSVPEALGMVGAEDLYREGHRLVFQGIVDLYQGGEVIEPLTVIEQLTRSGTLESAGGRNAVADLMETAFIAANVRSYAEIVRDTATQRRLLAVGQAIEQMVADREGATTEMMQRAEDAIFGLSQQRVRGEFRSSSDLVRTSMERLLEASERGTEITGLATGYADLDRLTGGLRPANLVVVAGRPSMGKTAFALGMAEHVVLETTGTVAVFSLEMSGEELVQRLLSSAAMVDAGRIRTGRLSQEDWPRVSNAADRLDNARLFIDDSEGMGVAEMRTKARRLKSREGLDLVIVDYIQLMEGPRGRRDDSRVLELSGISRALKMLARDLEVPVICVSQLNRAPEARPDKRPLLSDLRESGAIEQDADLVLMIYRDDYYSPDSEDAGVAEVRIAKNRNGPVDRVKLTFMGSYAKFGNLAREG